MPQLWQFVLASVYNGSQICLAVCNSTPNGHMKKYFVYNYFTLSITRTTTVTGRPIDRLLVGITLTKNNEITSSSKLISFLVSLPIINLVSLKHHCHRHLASHLCDNNVNAKRKLLSEATCKWNSTLSLYINIQISPHAVKCTFYQLFYGRFKLISDWLSILSDCCGPLLYIFICIRVIINI